MPSLYRALVPRSVSKALNPVNVPSVRSVDKVTGAWKVVSARTRFTTLCGCDT